MSLRIPYTCLQYNFIIWTSFERKFYQSWGNFFDGLFRTLEVILHGYMEKMLISNSKETVQDYQCELNFGELGIDIIESMHLFRVYSARSSSGTTDTLNFKVLIDCRTTKTRFLCYIDRNSFILPLFDYAEIVWGNRDNESLMSDLQSLHAEQSCTYHLRPLL